MEWKDLKFGKTVTNSKKFSRVVERIMETRLGPQAPDDRESTFLVLSVLLPLIDLLSFLPRNRSPTQQSWSRNLSDRSSWLSSVGSLARWLFAGGKHADGGGGSG